MRRRSARVLNGVAAVALVAGAIAVAPPFFAPTFELRNRSADRVVVVATWPGGTRRVDGLSPGARATFTVSGESAMAFLVRTPDGRERRAGPIYFTRGASVVVAIGDDAVTVGYAHAR